jgi:nicotinamide-nucleotide amidase
LLRIKTDRLDRLFLMTRPMSAEIICVGTELLLGDILNSNARYLAQKLAALGIAHYHQSVVGDNPGRIQQVIQVALDRQAQVLIFTGGLGPTPDDLTTATIAEFFQTPLVEHPAVVADIEQKYAQRGRVMTANNRRQALQPQGAEILPNPLGTAPGMMWQPRPGLIILTFPGVPREMYRMWQDSAIPYLTAQGYGQEQIFSTSLRFWGVSESALAEKVDRFIQMSNPTVAPYAGQGEVRLRVATKARSALAAAQIIDPVATQLMALAGAHYYGTDADSLASVVGQLLLAQGQTLAVAESCTGGMLGAILTNVPGSSAYFGGGVIAYTNAVKVQLLGVDPAVIAAQGAVSSLVAEQMAIGIKAQIGTDWGIGITGVAGPTGGTVGKPVGLVYIGLARPDGRSGSMKYQLSTHFDRELIRQMSAHQSLDMLRRRLLKI